MLFHPAILALYAGSLLVGFMVLYGAPAAWRIWRRWNLRSGSEGQLALERKTYLVSTLLAYAFGFELLSLFLFVFTAEQLHTFFVGAMCAAGSLYVNPYGYPTLILKASNCLLVGIWLIVNYADSRGEDYPLIRWKYLFFLGLVPGLLAELVLQAAYFLNLQPNIITSCCGALFSAKRADRPLWTGFLPLLQFQIVFYLVLIGAIVTGLVTYWKDRGGVLFSLLSLLALVVSVAAIYSFISPYIYELPTHACPFCLLQKDYGYIGYPLYITLLGAAIAGLSVAVLMPFRRVPTLSRLLPVLQRRLALTAAVLFLIFLILVTVRILMSGLVLGG